MDQSYIRTSSQDAKYSQNGSLINTVELSNNKKRSASV